MRACGFDDLVHIAFATEDHVAVQRLVARGLAVTTLPGLALGLHTEPGVTFPDVRDVGSRRVSAVVAAGPRPPAVAALLDELAAVPGATGRDGRRPGHPGG